MHMSAPSHEDRRAVRRFRQGVQQAGDSVASSMTEHLREHARGYGWPEQAVQHLSVRHAGAGFHPVVADEGRDIVHHWEYGSLEVRPRPAMRTWAARSHEHASDIHDGALADVIARELF